MPIPLLKLKVGTLNLTIACDNKLFVCDVAFSYSNTKSIIDLIDYFFYGWEIFTCDSLLKVTHTHMSKLKLCIGFAMPLSLSHFLSIHHFINI